MVKYNTINNNVFVVEKEGSHERVYDVYSKLLADRIIFLKGAVNEDSANSIVAQLLLLEQVDQDRPIHFYINSPGGSVTDGLAIVDTMRQVKAPIHTYCVGCAASMGALLLSSGDKRASLPNSWIMIHEPNQTFRNTTFTTTDQEIDTALMVRMRDQLSNILSQNTGQRLSKIKKDCQRDFWMTAKEAKDYGIIDEILSK